MKKTVFIFLFLLSFLSYANDVVLPTPHYTVNLRSKSYDEYVESPLLKEGERSIENIQLAKGITLTGNLISGDFHPTVIFVLSPNQKIYVRSLKHNVDIEVGTLSKKVEPENKKSDIYFFEPSAETQLHYSLHISGKRLYPYVGLFDWGIYVYKKVTIKAYFCHKGTQYRYKGAMDIDLDEELDRDDSNVMTKRSFVKLGACTSTNAHTELK